MNWHKQILDREPIVFECVPGSRGEPTPETRALFHKRQHVTEILMACNAYFYRTYAVIRSTVNDLKYINKDEALTQVCHEIGGSVFPRLDCFYSRLIDMGFGPTDIILFKELFIEQLPEDKQDSWGELLPEHLINYVMEESQAA